MKHFIIINLFLASLTVVKGIPPISLSGVKTIPPTSTISSTSSNINTQVKCKPKFSDDNFESFYINYCSQKGGTVFFVDDGNCGYTSVCYLPCATDNSNEKKITLNGNNYCTCEFVGTPEHRNGYDLNECQKLANQYEEYLKIENSIETIKNYCDMYLGDLVVKKNEMSGENLSVCLFPCQNVNVPTTYLKSLPTNRPLKKRFYDYCSCHINYGLPQSEKSTNENKCEEYSQSLIEDNGVQYPAADRIIDDLKKSLENDCKLGGGYPVFKADEGGTFVYVCFYNCEMSNRVKVEFEGKTYCGCKMIHSSKPNDLQMDYDKCLNYVEPSNIVTSTSTISKTKTTPFVIPISSNSIPMKITTIISTTTTKKCLTTGEGDMLTLECNRRNGKFYFQSFDNCGYLYVCLLPCDANVDTNTKTLPFLKSLPSNTNSNSSKQQIEGKSYCSCEIKIDNLNKRISTDMIECEAFAALLTDETTTPPPKTTTTFTTTTTTITNDERKHILEKNCNGGGGKALFKDGENGEFEYACIYYCKTYAKTIPTTTNNISSTSKTIAINVSQIQYKGNSFCACKMLKYPSNSSSTNLNNCNEFVNSLNENNNCVPKTIIVTEKVKETVTKKEMVTVTVTNDS